MIYGLGLNSFFEGWGEYKDSRSRLYKNYLEAAIAEPPSIVVLVPSHQHIGQAALANLGEVI